MKAFDLKIPLPGAPITLHTSDTSSHLNIINGRMGDLCLTPGEAKQLRDALTNAYPVEPKTFSKIAKGDTVTVSLTVTKVDTRHGVTMFSTDCQEWFEAHDAIGYVDPPKPKLKIEAGQVREFTCGPRSIRHIILATPLDADNVVAVRPNTPASQPMLVSRRDVEAARVITP